MWRHEGLFIGTTCSRRHLAISIYQVLCWIIMNCIIINGFISSGSFYRSAMHSTEIKIPAGKGMT